MKNETIPLSGSVCFIADFDEELPEIEEASDNTKTLFYVKIKPLPKVPIKVHRKEVIMSLSKDPITVQNAMELLDVQEQTAKLLLTSLEMDMLLIKYGRGPTAYWKKNTQ